MGKRDFRRFGFKQEGLGNTGLSIYLPDNLLSVFATTFVSATGSFFVSINTTGFSITDLILPTVVLAYSLLATTNAKENRGGYVLLTSVNTLAAAAGAIVGAFL